MKRDWDLELTALSLAAEQSASVTFDLGQLPSVTVYGLFDRVGLVRTLTQEEAEELAKHHPEILHLVNVSRK